MSQTIWTVGYSGWKPADLYQHTEVLNAVLCDIRYSPRSRVPQWNKGPLMAELGQRYVHINELGNRNYKGGPIEIVDAKRGIALVQDLLTQFEAAVLMCVCANFDTCHRSSVSEYIHYHLKVSTRELPKQSDGQRSLFTT